MINAKNKSSQRQDSKNKKETPDRDNRPKENPGKPTSQEELLYPHESETSPQREGTDNTFTARTDVTPPNKKEFPSVGPAKTDFESRRQGRTTGRMIGHEPGTESI
jgi:hypothetical protein